MASSNTPTRPGVVTLIGIIVWIQAVVAAETAITSFFLRNTADFQARSGQTANDLLVTAGAEALLAVLLVAVAMGIMKGSPGIRTFVAFVMAMRITFGVWTMLSHSGGYVAAAAITIAISLFVLWALYDHEDSSAFFAG